MQPTIRSLDIVRVVLAAIFYGTITVSGQYFSDLGFSLFEISFLLVCVALPLLPLVIAVPAFRLRRQLLTFYLSFGLIGALLQIAQFTGIILGVPVAVVALLLYTQPVWTTIFGKLLLDEPLTRDKLLAVVLAVTGALLLLDPFTRRFELPPLGTMAAVLAGILLSLWIIWGRKSTQHQEHYISTTFVYAGFSSLWPLFFYPLVIWVVPDPGVSRLDLSLYAEHWPAVLTFTLISGILPAALIFSSMRNLEASTAGILLLFEPVSAALLANVMFGQPLTQNIWVGGGIILLANIVMLRPRKKTARA